MSRNIQRNAAMRDLPNRTAAAALPGTAKAGAQRTLSVEAVMDLASAMLWPEPMAEQIAAIVDADPRRDDALLAMLLVRSPDAATTGPIANLRRDTTPLGHRGAAPAQAVGDADAETTPHDSAGL
jgi:hypothetical protein